MNRTILILALLVVGSLCYSGEVGPSLSVYVVQDLASTGSRLVDSPEHRNQGYISREPAMRITALKDVTAKPVPWKRVDGKNNVLESGMRYRVQLVLIESDAVAIHGLKDAYGNRPVAFSLGEHILIPVSQPFEASPLEVSVRNEEEMLEIAKELKPLCAAAESSPAQLAEKCLREILGTKSVVWDMPSGERLPMIDVPAGSRGIIRSMQVKLCATLVRCGTREAVRALASYLDDNRYIYAPGDDYGSSPIAEDAAGYLARLLRERPELPGAPSPRGVEGLREWWKINKAAYESTTPTAPTPK